MKLWRNNRIDGEHELTIYEICDQFEAWAVRKPRENWPLDRWLREFMTSPDGLSSVWEDQAAYQQVFAEAQRRGRGAR